MKPVHMWSGPGKIAPVFRRYLFIWLLLPIIFVSCSSGPNLTTLEDLVIRIMTNPDPPRTGDGQLLIYITRKNGQAIDDVRVSLSVTASGMQSGTQDAWAVNRGSGLYVFPVKFHMESKYAVRLWVYRNKDVIAIQDSEIVLK